MNSLHSSPHHQNVSLKEFTNLSIQRESLLIIPLLYKGYLMFLQIIISLSYLYTGLLIASFLYENVPWYFISILCTPFFLLTILTLPKIGLKVLKPFTKDPGKVQKIIVRIGMGVFFITLWYFNSQNFQWDFWYH